MYIIREGLKKGGLVRFCFGRSSTKVQNVHLHKYFSNRFDYSSNDLLEIVLGLDRNPPPLRQLHRDHRWQHLKITLQKNVRTFPIPVHVHLLRVLTNFNESNDSLFQESQKFILLKLSELTLDELVTVLWVYAKNGIQKYHELAEILNKIENLLVEKDAQVRDKPEKKEKQKQISWEEPPPTISPLNLCLILWSLSKLKLEHSLPDFIIKKRIIPSPELFTVKMLILAMNSLVKLNLGKKKSTKAVLQIIQSREQEFKDLVVLTLRSFIEGASEVQGVEPKFLLRIADTFIKRHNENTMSIKFAVIVLYSLGRAKVYNPEIYRKLLNTLINNIQKAQIRDLSMTIHTLGQIEHRKQLQKQQNQILQMIWNNIDAFTGKSRRTIQSLVISKSIKAPSKIVKMFEKEYQKQRQKTINSNK